ncbi:hypothetical protein WJX75_003138 [Coccomyxa subellipsoidea]|uniref:Protein kinase domain-containing protein n=1 Tax=Coccomyxa subellipsoidea TaxID=248742 RepID=A0ABR2YP97_9CHLO
MDAAPVVTVPAPAPSAAITPAAPAPALQLDAQQESHLLQPTPLTRRWTWQAFTDINFARDVTLQEKIGSGAFGSVYRAQWRGRPVAVKVMTATHSENAAELESFRREVEVLSGLQHDRIVRLLGACLAPPTICIVEELALGGSLYDLLHTKSGARCCTPMPHSQLLRVALDVAEALRCMHHFSQPQILHRDLKSSNVLLDSRGRAKVCDFGIAKFKDRTFVSTKNANAGTPAYMAPEMFEGRRVSEKIDVYSFGVLLWEMLTGELPWGHLSTPMQVIYVVGVLKKRLRIPDRCPEALRQLITQCWQDDADLRPSFTTIVPRLEMVLYKGFRHERSKGDDGLRTNYWYLQRVDGSEDLAVIGREIKGSGGHYNYNSAPLFGMLSWVNSSEVRRWLQTKIADTQTLRSAAAGSAAPNQDALYSVSLPSHGSDPHLSLGQDLGIRTSNAAGGNDLPWGLTLSSATRASLDVSNGMVGASAPCAAMLGSLVGAHSGEMGFIADKHQRNAVIGHTLGLIEAQLDALRQRTGVEYTMTLVTQEREIHVLGSAAVTFRTNSSPHASTIAEVSNM